MEERAFGLDWGTNFVRPKRARDSLDGDALRLLTGTLRESDCQDSVLHRGLYVLKLNNVHQPTVPSESVRVKHPNTLWYRQEA